VARWLVLLRRRRERPTCFQLAAVLSALLRWRYWWGMEPRFISLSFEPASSKSAIGSLVPPPGYLICWNRGLYHNSHSTSSSSLSLAKQVARACIYNHSQTVRQYSTIRDRKKKQAYRC
jgi:hypothetical protein